MNFEKEDVIDKWEEKQEKKFGSGYYWEVELRDFAAENLRNYNVKDHDEVRNLAIDILSQLGYNSNSLNLNRVVNILEDYVNFNDDENEQHEFFVTESLDDILKSKLRK